MTRRCANCDADISHRPNAAKRCEPCAEWTKRTESILRSREIRSQAHMPRVDSRTARCICCHNKFRPTKTRTRLCLYCYTDGSGLREHSCAYLPA